jgi:uncharacterized membrane protein
LWINLIFLMALCLVPFATSVLGERDARVGFMLYACVMALVTLLSAGMSAYGLREPFLDASGLRPGVRRDMILSPLSSGAIFLIAVGLAYANLTNAAHWIVLLIFPISAMLGSRSRGSA